ncbi:MAG: hypothetical protein ABI760_09570 [Ferruginibacter sp.]
MPELASVGICLYCNKEFTKDSISRHLDNHLAKKTNIGKPGKSFLVKIEINPKWGNSPYFLQLWIDGNSTMQELDTFLRQIWLECCGHMSAFRNPKIRKKEGGILNLFSPGNLSSKGKQKWFEKITEEDNDEIPKGRKAKEALKKDLKLVYEYDFGTTTELHISVSSEYSISADEKIVLLSRNEPPVFLCETCRVKPATKICSVCIYEDESAFCNDCAKKHAKKCPDFNDYSSLPVVNSPRMGVCAYEGGRIDTKRDGLFVKK